VECVFRSIVHGLADDDAAPSARPHDHVYRLVIAYETTRRREALRGREDRARGWPGAHLTSRGGACVGRIRAPG
ncbi:MAG: hypothetical protein ACKODB_04460, partial [Betaproteobacteria bacterium]